VFRYSTDGTALITQNIIDVTTLTAGMTLGIDSPIHVGCTVDLDNGSNSVFQAIRSLDGGVTWSTVGSAATGATITALFDSTSPVTVGGRGSSASLAGPFSGNVFEVYVYRGLTQSDPVAISFDASLYNSGNFFTGADGLVWTAEGTVTITAGAPFLQVMNGSIPGGVISYMDDATRRAALNAAPADVTIVNLGHNDHATTLANYSTLVANILAINPHTSIVVCRQNPQHSTATNYLSHNRQQQRLAQLAARQNWGVIDAFSAFVDTDTPDTYVEVAGVHPTVAGYQLWANEAARSFGV
jgi:hypothetical protein